MIIVTPGVVGAVKPSMCESPAPLPRQGQIASPECNETGPYSNFEPAAPARNWKELVFQISQVERERYQDSRRTEAERLDLQRQIGALRQEKESAAQQHRTHVESLKREFERLNRESILKLRRENSALEEEVRLSNTRAQESEMRRLEAVANLETLERKIQKLEVQCARREADAEKEIERVKGERDASYRRTQEHAEERVKAMCSLAKEAQDKMYKNMDALDKERRRLTVRQEPIRGSLFGNVRSSGAGSPTG